MIRKRNRFRGRFESLEARQLLSTTIPDTSTPFVADWSQAAIAGTSGTNLRIGDSAGNLATFRSSGFPLTIVNGAGQTPQPDPVGPSLAFDGLNQYGDAGPSPGSNSSLSFSTWFDAKARADAVLASKSPNDASGVGWDVELKANGTVVFKVGSQGNFATISSNFVTYSAGAWTQVVVTFSNRTATLSLNGQQVASGTLISQMVGDPTTNFTLAKGSTGSVVAPFAGLIANPKIDSIALTPAAIGAEYVVDQLPSVAPSDQLKKADLTWEVEDAITNEAYAAQYGSSIAPGIAAWAKYQAKQAAGEYSDVTSALGSSTIATPGGPSTAFPSIPNTAPGADHNVVFDKAQSNFAGRFTDSRINQRPVEDGAAHNPESSVNTFDGASEGIWAMAEPQSDFRPGGALFNPMVQLAPILRQLQVAADAANFTIVTGQFSLTSQASDEALAKHFLEMRIAFPNLLLPTQVQAMSTAIKADANALANTGDAVVGGESFGQKMLKAIPGTLYMNNDIRALMALEYADLAFPELNNKYQAVVDGGLKLAAASIYPDGASPYISAENEQWLYHNILVGTLNRFSQIANDPRGNSIVAQTYWYYPLSYEPAIVGNPNATGGGGAEYATSPSWKHYWNSSESFDLSYKVGMIAQAPEDVAVALADDKTLGWSDFNASTLWNPSVFQAGQATPIQNNDFVYDRNIDGPRTRFGEFSTAGTAGEASPPGGGINRGKSSFIAATVLNNRGLDSAIDTLGVGPVLGSTPRFDGLAENEQSTSLVTSDAAALATTYTPNHYESGLDNAWQGQQEWVFTDQRLVGLLTLTAKQATSADAVQSVVRLISGNRTTNVTQDPTDPNLFYLTDAQGTRHNLAYRVISQDFGTVQPTTPNTDGNNVYGVDLTFGDRAATPTPTTYPAGTTRHFLVEIYDQWTAQPSPSRAIAQVTPGNALNGIDVVQGTQEYLEVSNPTDAPLTYTYVAGAGGASIHTSGPNSGEQYRPSWTDTHDTSTLPDFRGAIAPTTPSSVGPGTVTITIPGHSQILIEPTIKAVQGTVNNTVGVSFGTSGTSALDTAADGLRLLPAGRATDAPWLGINSLTIHLNQPETLLPTDISATGLNGTSYGPVTLSGSGTTYVLTLAQPINAADRVTLTIGNANIATFTRRLDVLPGDFNDDGVVNMQDAILVRNEYLGFSAASPTIFGDIDGNGVVDVNDYNAIRRRLGTHLP